MPIIEVDHMTKDYGHGRGVFDVSIKVEKGVCYGYLGPNGAGKTTTIRHLMGFSKPQSGSTAILGRDSWKHAAELKAFDQSGKEMAFGGGFALWFFISSLLGMFGTGDIVKLGIGTEELNIFNKLTLVGLFDIDSLSTVGSGNVDYSFVWKLCVLAGVAVITYVVGNVRFQKKDLPL